MVLGGGMTGAQFCLAQQNRWTHTSLVVSGPRVTSDFDTDPCWIGPKCRTADFLAATPEQKRSAINAARRVGSLNSQVLEQLARAEESGSIQVIQSPAIGCENRQLLLANGERLGFDHLVLATGFEKIRPGGVLVDRLIEQLDLPVSPCGFPLTSAALEWSKGLFVMGGLAELMVGPVARNISGGRHAAKLILSQSEQDDKVSPKLLTAV